MEIEDGRFEEVEEEGGELGQGSHGIGRLSCLQHDISIMYFCVMVAISWKHSPYMSFEHLLNWFVGLASMSFLVPSYLFIYFSLLNHFSLLVSFLRIKIILILFFSFFFLLHDGKSFS